jgi:putative salt-induced outer membrane protein
MKTAVKRTALLMMIFLATATGLLADQITLKNGDRLTGHILNSDTKTLVIKTEAAGEVTVQWSAIEGVSSADKLHIGLTEGQVLVGPVKTEEGKIEVATATSGVVTAPRDSIVVIRSDAGQAEYDASVERLKHPHLLDAWSGLLDTGLSVTRGNSQTVSFTLAGKAVRQTDTDKISVYSTTVYGKTDNTSPSQTTAHQITGGVRGDLNITPRFFVFGTTDFDYNALQHLDLQNVLAGGAGYHVIKTKTTTFDVLGGAGYNQEYFSAYTLPNATPPPALLEFAAVTQKNAEMLIGEEFDATISKRTTFGETFTLYPNISGPSGYRIAFTSAVSTKLNNWLGWQLTLSDNYLSNPPFGIKGNDLLFATGLRVTFGKAGK